MRYRSIAVAAAASSLVFGTLAMASVATGAGPARAGTPAAANPATETGTSCFWWGPTATVDAADPENNYAFPDKQAGYYGAVFALPQGAHLTFEHEFAHARYQSLNSYNASTFTPTDALNDQSIVPDPGSRNPYLPGARRAGDAKRSYHATLLGTPPPASPADRAPNTIYAGVAGQSKVILVYRIYTPDRGRDAFGDVGLPRPTLHLADGTTLSGQAMCDAIKAEQHTTLALTTLPRPTYDALRNQPGKPAGFPASPVPVFRAAYNTQFDLGCMFRGLCSGTPVRSSGQYANLDNNYLYSYISRSLGDVLVLHGTMPRTPATFQRNPFMPDAYDVRYWSLCNNESLATTRATDCLYDEEIPVDQNGHYTIVLSDPEDRPRNATAANGVAWLAYSPNGDGAGHLDDAGVLLLRNMLPSPTFHHAVQNTHVPGDESAVMGEYLPTGTYMSTEQFEALIP